MFKELIGYDKRYFVSDSGNVFSLGNNSSKTGWRRWRKLSITMSHNGYCRVILRKNNKAIICRVHRLVAQCFIPNPNNLPQVNHKDENKKNNSVKNLEWCTALYNVQYSASRRRHKIQRGSKLKRLILQFDRSGKFISKFNSIYDAERKTGLFYLNKKFRSHVDNNNPKILYGYIWKEILITK